MDELKRILEETFVCGAEARAEIASTNDLALQMAAQQQLPTPFLVLAERQTAGRGRGSNLWWSAAGGLTFSLILQRPIVPDSPQDWPRISLATAVALCATLEDYLPHVKLGVKWPNDIHAAGRKIAGILVEIPNSPQLESRRVVVGIGLNVNNSWAGAPEELRAIGTAMCDLAPTADLDRLEVLRAALQQIEIAMRQLVEGDRRLNRSWQDLCVLGGKHLKVNLGRETVEGTCHGIDEEGALVVQSPTGAQRLFGGVIKSISEVLPASDD